MDILTLVADSCRYDSYTAAMAPALRRYFDIQSASAQATFTYPAHMAMFAGFYPSANGINRPLYDRFTMSLFRWFYNYARPHLISLESNTSIPMALKELGWDTQCVGGVGWFRVRDSLLANGFTSFKYETDPQETVGHYLDKASDRNRYALLNFGITHRPYRTSSESLVPPSPKSGCNYKSGYNKQLHECQVVCLEYLSECLERLFWFLLSTNRTAIVCFCADHGDCFGEDGCFGHGFYHPKVMEVPLGWTCFHKGEHFPINVTTIGRVKELVDGQNPV